ncbi:MAG TPA: rhamnulokinase [Prolixibacteraceae bacterium]|nr:rhamnulokinase [Prolixibacteraceae bacterium]
MKETHFLAFDIGASSGRAILGSLEGTRLRLKEVHRFKNQMMLLHGHYHWNIYSLFRELMTGLALCIRQEKVQPAAIGIDTWGVDYGLLTRDGYLAGLPFAYRDHRTDQAMEQFFARMDQEKTYQLSGIQFMQFNTLFQLYASSRDKLSVLDMADSLLFTPDILNWMFTGIRKNEYTIASTSALLKPGKAEWETELIKAAGVSPGLMEEIVLPGTILGPLLKEVCAESGSCEIPCVAVASHDTASAVASVPALGDNWAYISSGTWSLMGVESNFPVVTEKARQLNFTNEGGVDGTTRLLKNIMGLWLIQECKRIWDQDSLVDWAEIVELSRESEPFAFLIDPDHPAFLNPPDMQEAIREYCRKSGQLVPVGKAQVARCIYDSLALKYKYTLGQLEELTGQKLERIHIIGGGANNTFLCQLTADATGLPVTAGPVEATAIGNILIQARALGLVDSLDEMRSIVAASFEPVEYVPEGHSGWEDAYLQWQLITARHRD